jgi:hypothetical protein
MSPRTRDLLAPGLRNWDISGFKEFQVREYLELQFRGEFLNAFNTVRFSAPNTSGGFEPVRSSVRKATLLGRFNSR